MVVWLCLLPRLVTNTWHVNTNKNHAVDYTTPSGLRLFLSVCKRLFDACITTALLSLEANNQVFYLAPYFSLQFHLPLNLFLGKT